jgi:hypothetical protein
MNGTCSSSCGNTFHQFTASGDSIVINDYLFCDGISLTGPGRAYHLRFRAGNLAATTQVRIRRAQFYNAGVLVTPVLTSPATVQIPFNLAVGDSPLRVNALVAEPNPAYGRVRLVLDGAEGAAVTADILDVQGRLVRRLTTDASGARVRIDWDGNDSDGQRVRGGLYLARVRRGDRRETVRFVLMR